MRKRKPVDLVPLQANAEPAHAKGLGAAGADAVKVFARIGYVFDH
jgi:hypothetical protein